MDLRLDIRIEFEDNSDATIGEAKGLAIRDSTWTGAESWNEQACGLLGLGDRWSSCGIHISTERSADEHVTDRVFPSGDPGKHCSVDSCDDRVRDFRLGRKRSELDHGCGRVDDVGIVVELEEYGLRSRGQREAVTIDNSTGSTTCERNIQLQALRQLQPISAVVFKRNVSTVGISDREHATVFDLIAGRGVDDETIFIVDRNIVHPVILPDACERLENNLVRRGIVGERIIHSFDEQSSILGDGYHRTWKTIATCAAGH